MAFSRMQQWLGARPDSLATPGKLCPRTTLQRPAVVASPLLLKRGLSVKPNVRSRHVARQAQPGTATGLPTRGGSYDGQHHEQHLPACQPWLPTGTSAAPAPPQHSSTPPATAPTPEPASTSPTPITSSSEAFQLKLIHVGMFVAIILGGALFLSATMQFTSNMDFLSATEKVLRRIFKSVAFRQLLVIAAAILVVRFGLNAMLRYLSKFSATPVQWDKTKLYYVLREVYQPLELLLFIAGICTIADSFVPQLMNVPKATVSHVVRVTMSFSFIVGASVIVHNLKSRFCKENAWQCELKGDVTSQRRWEAYDKLGSFAIYLLSFILGIQALGLEVGSVLALGGIGGLVLGLAGREICENLLNGFLVMTTNPFEVGDEISFVPTPNRVVEGIVMDVGWYRTQLRSFEREVYVVPNAVFSKSIVLNISRKGREWRFLEVLAVRLEDVQKVNNIIQDIRRIVRSDARIINKLHRRVFLDKITNEDCKIYMSFYVEASNRDAFMAVKQDLLLAFVDCVERNGAKLAVPRRIVEVENHGAMNPLMGFNPMMSMPMETMPQLVSRDLGESIDIVAEPLSTVSPSPSPAPTASPATPKPVAQPKSSSSTPVTPSSTGTVPLKPVVDSSHVSANVGVAFTGGLTASPSANNVVGAGSVANSLRKPGDLQHSNAPSHGPSAMAMAGGMMMGAAAVGMDPVVIASFEEV